MRFFVYGAGHLAETLARAARCRGLGLVDTPDRAEIVFVADDVLDHAQLEEVWTSFCLALEQRVSEDTPIVVTSQVPPGWTRVAAANRPSIFYQVDTIIVRNAVERMVRPEQFIVGCEDPAVPLPLAYQEYLCAHGGPVHLMGYESAELAKCAINYFLTAQIRTTNVLAKYADKVGANWDDVACALRGDARIGSAAYLRPGEPNQHLLRDVVTIDGTRD